jgi:EAL domain-containing protein (putative c-di-GMP-specific phosphodiesterase class I)
MIAWHFRILCTAFLLWLSPTVLAAPSIDISTASGQGDIFLLDIIEVSEENANESLSPPAANAAWISQNKPIRTVGFKPSGVWIKAELNNSSTQTLKTHIQVGKPYMDKVDCFVNSPTGSQQIFRMGDKTFFENRPLPHADFLIPLEIAALSSKQLICFIKNDGATVADFRLWNIEAYQRQAELHSAFRTFNYGGIAFAVMTGICLGLWYRSWLFILLVADLLPSLLGIAALHTDGFQTLWPTSPSWNLPPYYWLYVGCLTVSLALLRLIRLRPREKTILRGLASVEFLLLLMSIANPRWGTLLVPVGFVLSFVMGFVGLALCIFHHKDGPIPKVMALCLGLQIMGNLINAFGLFLENILMPASWDFQLAFLVSSAVKALVLVFVIALRLSEDRKHHIKTQRAHMLELENKLAYETQLANLRANHAKYNLPNKETFQSSLTLAGISDDSILSVWIIRLNRMDYLKSLLSESHIIHALRDQANNFIYALQHEYPDRLHNIRGNQCIAALDDSTLAFCILGETNTSMQKAIQDFWLKHQKQNDMFIAWGPYFGVTELSKTSASSDALSQAQIALAYCSPQHRLKVFDLEKRAKKERTFGITLDLEGAIERGELKLYYQPKVTLRTKRTNSMEALARWQHPVQGMIPPDVFIPEAEATGAILKLTLWAIGHAAEFLRTTETPHLRIAINVSAFDLASAGFVDDVLKTLSKANTSAHRFIFEVTESTAIDDLPQTIAVLTALREAGAKIALDDFGTGHSTLGILEKLPVDELKIDRSFCQGLLESPQKKALMQTMIELSKRMGFTVTVEGVENRDIVAWLESHDCDTVQGYTFSRPLPAAEANQWLAQENTPAPTKQNTTLFALEPHTYTHALLTSSSS